MIAPARIVALGCVGLVACGHGGGGEVERARVAVGYRIVEADTDALNRRGVILRNDGGGWTAVGDDVLDEDVLGGVLFTSADIAWAYGSHTLVRSTDGGRSWEDVVPRLPEELRDGQYALRSLAFADSSTGYLGASLVRGEGEAQLGPYVWITRNGGETWSPGEDLEPRPNDIGFSLAVRAGEPEVLRDALTTDAGAVVQGFGGNDRPVEAITSVPTTIGGFDTSGERGWIAVTVIPGDDFAEARPQILTSARPGAAWEAQPVPDVFAQDFAALDMCDAEVGLAAGVEPFPSFRPLVFWTADGGVAWQSSSLPATEGRFSVSEVTCVDRGEMWMLAHGSTTNVTVAFRSEDGGRSFARVELVGDERVLLNGLASNAAFQ